MPLIPDRAAPDANRWRLAYQPAPPSADPNTGRLASATQALPGAGDATTSAVYDVSLGGMGPGEVGDWGQSDLPTDATAVVPPDGNPSTLERATITYMNRNGDAVNLATPDGAVSTTEYERHRLPRRSLTPGNRQRALAGSDSAATAQVLDTEMTYSAEGTELLETLGPLHEVILCSGEWRLARILDRPPCP